MALSLPLDDKAWFPGGGGLSPIVRGPSVGKQLRWRSFVSQ
jgi:hypothetical protein